MAFVEEDGSGLTTSNAYCSVAFVTAYLTESGSETAWSALANDTLREQAIVKASRYIDQRFGQLFLSTRRHRDQAMEWPREQIAFPNGLLWINSNEIPIELKRATAEYADRVSVAGTVLVADPTTNQQIVEKTETVGPITEQTRFAEYRGGGSTTVTDAAFSAYPAADLWVEKLIRGRQGSPLLKA